MVQPARFKVLIAVDGSPAALDAVRYAASILDPKCCELTLLHILTRVPESFIDSEQLAGYKYRIVSVEAWEQQQEGIINDFMVRARSVLSEAGFAEEAVTIRVEDRKVGIARDIAAESQNGYAALVVGRRGISELKDFMLGSIAHKILQLVRIPIWVVGGPHRPEKILMCLDNSEGAMLATRHLAQIICGSTRGRITLFYVNRGFGKFRQFVSEVFAVQDDKKSAEGIIEKDLLQAAKLLEPAFDEARGVLVKGGLDASAIDKKIVSGGSNAGNDIIAEAEKGGYDTIVIGRRGLSRVEEFLMGRVSSRVINLAKEKTVWVVS